VQHVIPGGGLGLNSSHNDQDCPAPGGADKQSLQSVAPPQPVPVN